MNLYGKIAARRCLHFEEKCICCCHFEDGRFLAIFAIFRVRFEDSVCVTHTSFRFFWQIVKKVANEIFMFFFKTHTTGVFTLKKNAAFAILPFFFYLFLKLKIFTIYINKRKNYFWQILCFSSKRIHL